VMGGGVRVKQFRRYGCSLNFDSDVPITPHSKLICLQRSKSWLYFIRSKRPFKETIGSIMDDDDGDVVPQLVTLDDHLSNEFDSKLTGSFMDIKTNSINGDDEKKVPISILTGILERIRVLRQDTSALAKRPC
jgi:hypothetical protein